MTRPPQIKIDPTDRARASAALQRHRRDAATTYAAIAAEVGMPYGYIHLVATQPYRAPSRAVVAVMLMLGIEPSLPAAMDHPAAQNGMSGGDFASWRARLGITPEHAAMLFRVTVGTVLRYEALPHVPHAVASLARSYEVQHKNGLLHPRWRRMHRGDAA